MTPLQAKQVASGKLHTPHHIALAVAGDGGKSVADRHATTFAQELDDTAKTIQDAEQRIVNCLQSLTEASKSAQARAKVCVSASKDYANQMADQLIKVDKLLGKDFGQRLEQMERFVSALNQLNALHNDGKLAKLLEVLK